MRARWVLDDSGTRYGVRFDCPGCGHPHVVPVSGAGAWGFNGDLERPSLTPSVLVYAAPPPADHQPHRCHSIVHEGRVVYCADSTHALSGQTADLPEVGE